MPENDSWEYQGRQYHMWFGNGTKPKDVGPSPKPKDASLALADRIRNVGYGLVAGLPPSQRRHPAVQLNALNHDRLDRVLTGVIHALPLGPRLTSIRVLGMKADAPGVSAFVRAGSVIHAAETNTELRTATDLIARSAQEVGLDHFKPFLRQADSHLTRTGGVPALLHDLPVPNRSAVNSATNKLSTDSRSSNPSSSTLLSNYSLTHTNSKDIPLECELPNGKVVPYLDLGNGFIAIPAKESGGSGSDFGSGVSIGIIVTGTGMPTVDKYGGLAGGGKSGKSTSVASGILRDLTNRARFNLLRSVSPTASVGGTIARTVPVLGVLGSFINFLNTQNAIQNAPICKPAA